MRRSPAFIASRCVTMLGIVSLVFVSGCEPDESAHRGEANSDASAPPDESDENAATEPDGDAAHNGLATVWADQVEGVYLDAFRSFSGEPVVFFKDGSACLDINIVLMSDELSAHKTERPKDWTEWKIVDGKKFILRGTNWRAIFHNDSVPPFSEGTSLVGTFTNTEGVSGYMSALLAQKTYRFVRDHRFAQGSFGAAVTDSAVFSGAPPARKGAYEIDGYVITLYYDDGTVVRTSFVRGDIEPRMLWLGGRGFLLEQES